MMIRRLAARQSGLTSGSGDLQTRAEKSYLSLLLCPAKHRMPAMPGKLPKLSYGFARPTPMEPI